MVLFENVLTRCLIGAAIRYHWGFFWAISRVEAKCLGFSEDGEIFNIKCAFNTVGFWTNIRQRF